MKTSNVNKNSGYIYVLKNESGIKYRYKVGMTKRDPSKRASELSTSYAERFIVEYQLWFSDARRAERKVFSLLKDHMPNEKREVVDVYDVDMIISTINYVSEIEKKYGW